MALELIANQIVPLSGMRFDSAALLQLSTVFSQWS